MGRSIETERKPLLQTNPDYIHELVGIINASSFPMHMSMRLSSIDLDQAVIELRTAQCHLQAYGIVHGGVLATLIDTATFWAAFLRIPDPDGLVNIDLKLNYLQPVIDGRLTARGTCLWPGNTISYSEAKVFAGDKRLIAHGTSTLMVLKGKGLKLGVGKFLED